MGSPLFSARLLTAQTPLQTLSTLRLCSSFCWPSAPWLLLRRPSTRVPMTILPHLRLLPDCLPLHRSRCRQNRQIRRPYRQIRGSHRQNRPIGCSLRLPIRSLSLRCRFPAIRRQISSARYLRRLSLWCLSLWCLSLWCLPIRLRRRRLRREERRIDFLNSSSRTRVQRHLEYSRPIKPINMKKKIFFLTFNSSINCIDYALTSLMDEKKIKVSSTK